MSIASPDPGPRSQTRAERQAVRDRLYPVGMACVVHDGTRATVPAVIIANTGVMLRVRLDADGREVPRYDHEVYAPDADEEPTP